MSGFERVYTMNDSWDGPLTGIADFGGVPHTYHRPFDETRDEICSWYELRPVDEETLQLAMEAWAIWLRWVDALHAGETTAATHPALPADRARRSELRSLLDARLAARSAPPVRAMAAFRQKPGHEHAGRHLWIARAVAWLEVKWTVLNDRV